ncbi:glycosyl transferase family 2 [Acidithiobacillus ferrivorans SS3]|uniref:Glycosyl transferase family 2 n=1 Tax=Acidithiobacillus ferrivorans SS3 TaxID=743299 RepID=G0JP99_9PROT|nr:glycosyltransferase [Acidithiobacillus ferrivorans]AEM47330.1 glycosyl transferase family 2 [Acidithiobacillus ferrivorans SS3]
MIADRENLDITEPPKVTIAIPTYNRSAFLTEALDSALAQTFQNIEVIVSDNASTDNTLQLLGNYNYDRLIVIQQETNLGMMGNWNSCLNKASGELFLLLSDDDFLEPTAIEKMANIFRYGMPDFDSSKIGMVYCKSRIVDGEGALIGYGKHGAEVESASLFVKQFFRCNRTVNPCGVMMRTSDIQSLGGYDGLQYPLAADANAWMAIAIKRGNVACIDEVLTNYRVHTSNVTSEVGIGEWITDNSNLAKMSIGKFLDQGDHRSAKSIERLIHKFNAKAISGLIQLSVEGKTKKGDAIKDYIINAKYFFGLQGLFIIAKGVIKIYLPKSITRKIQKLLSLLG